MCILTGFVDELIDETFGTSNKRWALVVCAVGAGALGALWLVGDRRRSAGAGSTGVAVSDGADDPVTLVGGMAADARSVWTKISTPPAMMRKALSSNPVTDRLARSTARE
ncbi:MAG: hypothetical protein ABW122_05480 [Ilumatobacteraceae bacterium]